MRTAAELRREVESALAGRIPAALSMRPAAVVELVSCGVAEVDAALGGGFPIGAITELTGMDSSGRTTLALSTLAEITQRGESCAYVDVSDAFDPLSAAALGVELQRLLWVRAGDGDATTAVSRKQVAQKRHGKGGAPDSTVDSRTAQKARKPWSRLDQSLRAVDLLLNTGGFRAIVLDMGDIDPEHARRVPLAMWYRFRLQAEKSRTLLLLLTRTACANSCTAVSLCCAGAKANWHQATDAGPGLLAGLSYGARVTRNIRRGGSQNLALESYGKKPAASARTLQRPLQRPLLSSQTIWSSTTSWSG